MVQFWLELGWRIGGVLTLAGVVRETATSPTFFADISAPFQLHLSVSEHRIQKTSVFELHRRILHWKPPCYGCLTVLIDNVSICEEGSLSRQQLVVQKNCLSPHHDDDEI